MLVEILSAGDVLNVGAVHALLHGHIRTALHDNARVVVLLPLACYWIGTGAARMWRTGAWSSGEAEAPGRQRLALAVVIAAALFMLVRNVPGALFERARPLPQ